MMHPWMWNHIIRLGGRRRFNRSIEQICFAEFTLPALVGPLTGPCQDSVCPKQLRTTNSGGSTTSPSLSIPRRTFTLPSNNPASSNTFWEELCCFLTPNSVWPNLRAIFSLLVKLHKSNTFTKAGGVVREDWWGLGGWGQDIWTGSSDEK